MKGTTPQCPCVPLALDNKLGQVEQLTHQSLEGIPLDDHSLMHKLDLASRGIQLCHDLLACIPTAHVIGLPVEHDRAIGLHSTSKAALTIGVQPSARIDLLRQNWALGELRMRHWWRLVPTAHPLMGPLPVVVELEVRRLLFVLVWQLPPSAEHVLHWSSWHRRSRLDAVGWRQETLLGRQALGLRPEPAS